MKDQIIAQRYADGFFKYAEATCGWQKAIEDFRAVRDILADNPGLLEYLESPAATLSEKEGFIERVFGEGFSLETRDFLKLLLKKGRVGWLWEISECVRVNYSHGLKVNALLKTSFPLELGLVRMIIDKLEAKFKKKLKLYIELDGSLLGGIKVIVGNLVIDGSVRRRIDDLKLNLEAIRMS